MSGFLTTLLKRPSIRDRRFQRIQCERPAELAFPERKFSLHGIAVEISQGGALFREPSAYILDRRRSSVVLRIAGREIPGVIVNVRPAGYGIRFDELISEDLISEVVVPAFSEA